MCVSSGTPRHLLYPWPSLPWLAGVVQIAASGVRGWDGHGTTNTRTQGRVGGGCGASSTADHTTRVVTGQTALRLGRGADEKGLILLNIYRCRLSLSPRAPFGLKRRQKEGSPPEHVVCLIPQVVTLFG